MDEFNAQISELLNSISNEMENLASVSNTSNDFFSSCLGSAITKSYEFANLVSSEDSHFPFFYASSLRGITEDVIVLKFLSGLPESDRQTILRNMMLLEVHRKIEIQNRFFEEFRPLQPVLKPRHFDAAFDRDGTIEELRTLWRSNGWPNLSKRESPPVAQIAIRTNEPTLKILYDFVYRLSSGLVHFNPQPLLRAGWGSDETDTFHFSMRNMEAYYSRICVVYGTLIFCLYFRFFKAELSPSESLDKTIASVLRCLVVSGRWPEIVTFEEMNVKFNDRFLNPLTFGIIACEHLRTMSEHIDLGDDDI